jgi:hypothetical protein
MRFNFLKLDMLCRQLFWQWNMMRVLFLEQTLAPLQVTAELESTLSMTQNPNVWCNYRWMELCKVQILESFSYLKNHYSSLFLKKSNLKRLLGIM